eukprot:COSAG01_NODE_4370_length_5090_cov_80.890002_4_plen_140_part_00
MFCDGILVHVNGCSTEFTVDLHIASRGVSDAFCVYVCTSLFGSQSQYCSATDFVSTATHPQKESMPMECLVVLALGAFHSSTVCSESTRPAPRQFVLWSALLLNQTASKKSRGNSYSRRILPESTNESELRIILPDIRV